MKKPFIPLFLGTLLIFSGTVFPLLLPLKVKDNAAQSRTNVPVQNSVPLPKGAYHDSDLGKFGITDSVGNVPISAGFWAPAHWNDGSIKFLAVNFQATVTASGSHTYMLSDVSANPGNSQLQVTQSAGSVTVNTGVLKFVVKGTGFNIIDQAWCDMSGAQAYDDAHQIMASGNASTLRARGNTYSGNMVLSIAYQNQEQVCIQTSLDTTSADAYMLTITAYRNKPYVKIIHHWYNNRSVNFGSTMNNLSMNLKTEVSGNVTATFSDITTAGTKSRDVSLTSAETAFLVYVKADSFNIMKGSTRLTSGQGQNFGSGGTKDMGWVHLTNGSKAIGTGMRYFWEMAPKSLDVSGDGTVDVGMYSSHGPTIPWYGGSGRTHLTFLNFGGDAAMTKEAFYSTAQPLMAIPPTVWMCGKTKAFGAGLVHNDATLFASTTTEQNKYKTLLNVYKFNYSTLGYGAYKTPLALPFYGLTDLHNFINFGDNVDPVNSGCPGMQHFGNNYYDMPFMAAECFAMNGDLGSAYFGMERTLQCLDMDHDNGTGDCKTTPGVQQFLEYFSCTPGNRGNTAHWKTQGSFYWSFIYAEPLLKSLALRITEFPMTGFMNSDAARATSHAMEGMLAAYEATGDQKYLNRTRQYYSTGQFMMDSLAQYPFVSARIGGMTFMDVIIGEGLGFHSYVDTAYAHGRERLLHWAMEQKRMNLQDSPAVVFPMWALWGISEAIRIAPADTAAQLKMLGDTIFTRFLNSYYVSVQSETRAKVQAENYKGLAQYFSNMVLNPNYLSTFPDYLGLVAVEKSAEEGIESLADDAVSAKPNPFNPSVQLSLNITLKPHQPFSLRVYDCTGRLAANLTERVKNRQVIWNAGTLASGVYILKLNANNRVYTKSLMLMK